MCLYEGSISMNHDRIVHITLSLYGLYKFIPTFWCSYWCSSIEWITWLLNSLKYVFLHNICTTFNVFFFFCFIVFSFTDPEWASYTLGVFVCHSCSGLHRNIAQISKVKSIFLDPWSVAELEVKALFTPSCKKKTWHTIVFLFVMTWSHRCWLSKPPLLFFILHFVTVWCVIYVAITHVTAIDPYEDLTSGTEIVRGEESTKNVIK